MSKPTTKHKMKYNKATYSRYEFTVRNDTKLDHAIEQYKSDSNNSLSGLVRELLSKHFEVSEHELYVPYHFEQEK